MFPLSMLLVLFGFVTLNYIGSNSKKIHNCVHNKLQRKATHKTFVQYSYDLNYVNIDSNKRRLYIPIEEYSPIRIKPYWDAIDSSSLSTTKKNIIKALVSSSINYFESFLSVIPVEGPLFVPRKCSYGWSVGGPLHSYWNCADQEVLSQCGSVVIPSTHLRNEWMYGGYDDDVDVNSYPAGSGLSDTDLIIYVSADSDSCDVNTLAWAQYCAVDQYGRPISGNINFCPSSLDEIDWKMDILTTIHELTHILVFDSSLFPHFIDIYGNPLHIDNIVQQVTKTDLHLNNTYLITPNIKSFVREHYGCNNLVGAPLEDDGSAGTAGSHWEEHHINGEYMIGSLYNKLNYVSKLTLALFEDSGWYKVDYNYSEPYSWGKNEGCDFFNQACFDPNTGLSNFPQYFCEAAYSSSLCTYDYSAQAFCFNFLNSSHVPSMFKYFSDAHRYGPVNSEHCPFADAYNDYTYNDFQHVCWDERGNSIDSSNNVFGQVYGINSRCVKGSVGSYGMESFCYPLECDLNNQQIIININYGQVICNKADKYKYQTLLDDGTGTGAWYNISCPNYDSICVNDKPFECLWGFWNNDLNQCICSAGYEGSVCNESLIDLQNAEVSLYTNSFDGNNGYKNTICLKLGTTHAALNGDWQYVAVHNNIYPYYEKDIYYLYFETKYHLWSIGTVLGKYYSSKTVIGVCSIGERPYDVSDCSNFFYFVDDEHDKWTQDINLVIGTYECPVSPTPSPTLCPTCTDFPESRPVNTFYTDDGDMTDSAITVKACIILPLYLLIFFAVIT